MLGIVDADKNRGRCCICNSTPWPNQSVAYKCQSYWGWKIHGNESVWHFTLRCSVVPALQPHTEVS